MPRGIISAMDIAPWMILAVIGGVIGFFRFYFSNENLENRNAVKGKVKCPECLAFIPKEAKKCQHCGSSVNSGVFKCKYCSAVLEPGTYCKKCLPTNPKK